MPLEDQGYCIVIAQLPSGSSQPRVRQLAANIDSVLKKVAGLKGWVTIGGYSGMDSAKMSNVITTFVMFNDWGSGRRDLRCRLHWRRFKANFARYRTVSSTYCRRRRYPDWVMHLAFR